MVFCVVTGLLFGSFSVRVERDLWLTLFFVKDRIRNQDMPATRVTIIILRNVRFTDVMAV